MEDHPMESKAMAILGTARSGPEMALSPEHFPSFQGLGLDRLGARAPVEHSRDEVLRVF